MRYVFMLSILVVITSIGSSLLIAETPEWTFDDLKEAKDELKEWVDLNQLSPLEVDEVKDGSGRTRGVLKTESLGGDPYMFPGGGWNVRNYEPFDGEEFDTL